MSAEEAEITITKEQKAVLSQGIIEGTLKMMERTITRKSPRKCARDDSKPYNQSKMAITANTTFFNVLTNHQQLPARPRDFKRSLADEEKNIRSPELSDVLSAMVRRYLLEPKRDTFPFPRGRPRSDTKIADGRRGRLSYYEPSRIKQIIDEVLRDQESFNKIDNAVTSSGIFHRYRIYSFEASLHQMKENERAFLNSIKPAIKKYGLKYMKTENLDNSSINAKDVSDDLIKKIARDLALNTKLAVDEKNILYTAGGIFFFDHIIQKQDYPPNS